MMIASLQNFQICHYFVFCHFINIKAFDEKLNMFFSIISAAVFLGKMLL